MTISSSYQLLISNSFFCVDFQMPKNKSAISFSAEKIADDTDSCKELQASGSVKMTTYKAFFHAAHSNILVIVVLAVFIVSQFAWTGADYFLSEW